VHLFFYLYAFIGPFLLVQSGRPIRPSVFGQYDLVVALSCKSPLTSFCS
jgi:hypothetical protein